jgi:hypothetical protein
MCLHIPTFRIGGRTISLLLNVRKVNDVRQIEIHTDEPLVPEPSPFEVQIAIARLKKYKSPASDHIPAELIQAGGRTLQYEIHKLINCTWSKEELPDQLKESIIVPFYKKGDKTDCSNYRGISLLSTSHKILSNTLLPKSSPYVDESIGDQHCGFRRNRSTTNQIFALVRYWRKNRSTIRQYISYSLNSRQHIIQLGGKLGYP